MYGHKHSTTIGATTCIQCGAGKYQTTSGATTSSTCSSCPAGSSSPPGSGSANDCKCNSGLSTVQGQRLVDLNFSTITEIPGRDSDFDQKLILAAGGQLNGGDGMRGRRDLGGRWPACSNALHIGTYMDAQRRCGLCSEYCHAVQLTATFCFFQKEKAPAHIRDPSG